MAAIHPMVFSIKNDVKKLEERIKKLEEYILADKAESNLKQEKS